MSGRETTGWYGNLPWPRGCATRPRRPAPPHGVEAAAALTLGLWAPGTTLRIAFSGGRLADRAAVMKAAAIWMEHANIRIVQVASGPAELRFGFDKSLGSWSYVGKECLTIPADRPTGNMGWPDDPGRDLHELGHALGLEHEHETHYIPWNKSACYAFYGGPPNNWSEQEVDEQVLSQLDPATLTETALDKQSIMLYPCPAALLTDPSFATGWNETLSDTDKAFIARMYPR